jgi:hypothetical protein
MDNPHNTTLINISLTQKALRATCASNLLAVEKVTVARLANKCYAFQGTRRFVTALKAIRLSRLHPLRTLTFLKTNFNRIPSTPRYPKRSRRLSCLPNQRNFSDLETTVLTEVSNTRDKYVQHTICLCRNSPLNLSNLLHQQKQPLWWGNYPREASLFFPACFVLNQVWYLCRGKRNKGDNFTWYLFHQNMLESREKWQRSVSHGGVWKWLVF